MEVSANEGWEYVYIDSTMDIRDESMVFDDLREPTSAFYQTVSQIRGRKQTGSDPVWVAYSDQPKSQKWSSLSSNYLSTANGMAHAKGLAVYTPGGTNQGFHIIHSCPGFPEPSGAEAFEIFDVFSPAFGPFKFPWLRRCNKYGQQFGCYNFVNAAKVMDDLTFSNVFVYRANVDLTLSKIPAPLKGLLDPSYKLANQYRKACETKPSTNCERQTKFSFGSINFNLISQASKHNKAPNEDVWLIAMGLAKSSMSVQNWRRTADVLSVKTHGSNTLRDSALYGGVVGDLYEEEWKDTSDHAKIGWTYPDKKEFSCHGGLNRERSQLFRGGAILCSDSYAVTTLVNRMERAYYEKSGPSKGPGKKISKEVGEEVSMKHNVQYKGANLDGFYPMEARDLNPKTNGFANKYIVPLPLLYGKNNELTFWSSTGSGYAVLPLISPNVAVCDCTTATEVCTYANAKRILPDASGGIKFSADENYEVYRYIARLRETNHAVIDALADPVPFLGVCITKDAVYSIQLNTNNQMQIVLPRISDKLSKTPLYGRIAGGVWCYDCVAQQFARWAMYTASAGKYYLADNQQSLYIKPENVEGGALYFGLSWALGLGFRYSNLNIKDYPNDPKNERLKSNIQVVTGEKDPDYPLEKLIDTALPGQPSKYAARVAQATWDLLDAENDGGDTNNLKQVTLAEFLAVIQAFGPAVPATKVDQTQSFFKKLYAKIAGPKKDPAAQILVYDKIFNAKKDITGKRSVRDDGDIPDFSALNALLKSYNLDPTLVDSANMQTLYEDGLSLWFFPNSASSWANNRGLQTVVYPLNMQANYSSALTYLVASIDEDAPFSLEFAPNVTVPQFVNPDDITTLSRALKLDAQHATNFVNFTADLVYLFWPAPISATQLFKAPKNIGLYIIKYNGLLCNFGETNPSGFLQLTPSSIDCPTGPIIASVTPQQGPTSGGIPITITGFNIDIITSATIGTLECPIVSQSDTQVICTLPAGSSAYNPIVLTNSLGTNLPDRWNFVYNNPVLLSVSPSLATRTTGGESVVITGDNFGPTTLPISDLGVTVGGFPCESFTHDSQTQITCVLPPGTGVGNVVFVNVSGQGSDDTEIYVDYPAPIISSISPTSGPVAGGELTITGSNFGLNSSLVFVAIDQYEAAVLTSSDTQLVVAVQALVGSDLIVTVDVDGQTAESPTNYSVVNPSITEIIGNMDTSGSYIDIIGLNLGATENLEDVVLSIGPSSDPYSAVVQVSDVESNDTLLYAFTPPGIGVDIPVQVSVGDLLSEIVYFSYAPPAVYGYGLSSNLTTNGGIEVFVLGDNLVPIGVSPGDITYSNVTIGGALCETNASSWINTQQVTCVAPKGIGANVSLCAAVGSQVSMYCANFSYPVPVVSSFSPTNGSANGPTNITIIGSNFVPVGVDSGNSTVWVGNETCQHITWVNATTIFCNVSAGYGTNLCVIVQIGNQSSLPVCGFSFLGPIITDMMNRSMSTLGGKATVYGDNFGIGTISPVVYFNGSAIPTTYINGTALEVTIPPGTGKNKTMYVKVANQTSPVVTFFSYNAPVIDSIEPRNSDTPGQIQVFVRGENYGPGHPLPQVYFDGKPVTTKWDADNEVQFTVPQGEGTGKVIFVLVDGQYSNNNTDFSFNAPIINNVIPNEYSTKGGITLNINGSNFGFGNPTPLVSFNGVNHTCTRQSHTLITLPLPAGIGAQIPIIVYVADENSATNRMFSYSVPTISSTSLSADTDGGVITINGASFVPRGIDPGSNSNVTVDGELCTSPTWQSDTVVKCTVAAGTGKNKEVVVTVGGQASAAYPIFSYNDPSVTSIQPRHSSTRGGVPITINGKSFGPGNPEPKAYLLPFECTDLEYFSSKKLTCTIPEGSGTRIGVQVDVGSAESAANPLFDYDAPRITSITPASCGKNGKKGVKLAGTSFGGIIALARGKVTLTMDGEELDIKSIDHESVTFNAPSSDEAKTVRVTLKVDGQTSNAVLFTYTDDDSDDSDNDDPDDEEGNDPNTPGIPVPADVPPLILLPFPIPIPHSNPPPGDVENCTLSSCSCAGSYFTDDQTCGCNISCVGAATCIPISPNQLTFCSSVNYNAFPRAIASNETNVMVTPAFADQQAQAVYNFYVPYVSGDPNALKQLLCASAFLRCSDSKVQYPCRSLYEAALASFDATYYQSFNITLLAEYIISQPEEECTLPGALIPVITSIDPVHGPAIGGTRFLINGANFGTVNSTIEILLGDSLCPYLTYASPNALLCLTPPGSGQNKRLQVYVDGQTSDSNYQFSYDGPVITTIGNEVPTSGGALTVYGTNFGKYLPAISIWIDGLICTNATRLNDSLATCSAPSGQGNNHSVVIEVNGQYSSGGPPMSYEAPNVTSVVPSSIPELSSTQVVITGTNFGFGPAVVIIAGPSEYTLCTNVLYLINHTTITCLAPPGTGVNLDISVTVASQTSPANTFLSYYSCGNMCNHRGVCRIDGSCVCTPPYSGAHCEVCGDRSPILALPTIVSGNAFNTSTKDVLSCSVNEKGQIYSVVGTGNFMVASTCNLDGGSSFFNSELFITDGPYCGNASTTQCAAFASDNCPSGTDPNARVIWASVVGSTYDIFVTGANSSAQDYFGLVISDCGDLLCSGQGECIVHENGETLDFDSCDCDFQYSGSSCEIFTCANTPLISIPSNVTIAAANDSSVIPSTAFACNTIQANATAFYLPQANSTILLSTCTSDGGYGNVELYVIETHVCITDSVCLDNVTAPCANGQPGGWTLVDSDVLLSVFVLPLSDVPALLVVAECGNARCSGLGVCAEDGSCICDTGRFGEHCELNAAACRTTLCSGHGQCLEGDGCQCDKFYFGSNCSFCSSPTPLAQPFRIESNTGSFVSEPASACSPVPVSGTVIFVTGTGGTFVVQTCEVLPTNLTRELSLHVLQGDPCTTAPVCTAFDVIASSPCVGSSYFFSTTQGMVYDLILFDPNNITAFDYNVTVFDVDACALNVCSGNGGCLSDFTTCQCNMGFFGQHCEQNAEQCRDIRCSGHGNCIPLTSDGCNCDPNFGGANCQTCSISGFPLPATVLGNTVTFSFSNEYGCGTLYATNYFVTGTGSQFLAEVCYSAPGQMLLGIIPGCPVNTTTCLLPSPTACGKTFTTQTVAGELYNFQVIDSTHSTVPSYPYNLTIIDVDQCRAEMCSGNGACSLNSGVAVCTCDFGFFGTNCELSAADCALERCSGNGSCMTESAVLCQCNRYYSGSDCSVCTPFPVATVPKSYDAVTSSLGLIFEQGCGNAILRAEPFFVQATSTLTTVSICEDHGPDHVPSRLRLEAASGFPCSTPVCVPSEATPSSCGGIYELTTTPGTIYYFLVYLPEEPLDIFPYTISFT